MSAHESSPPPDSNEAVEAVIKEALSGSEPAIQELAELIFDDVEQYAMNEWERTRSVGTKICADTILLLDGTSSNPNWLAEDIGKETERFLAQA